MIGTLIHAVFRTVASGYEPEPFEAAVVATIHFLLPIAIAYTVFTNSHLSRPFILIYSIALAASLIFGFGYVGPAFDGALLPRIAFLFALALIAAWLFFSPKMQIYYALLRDRPLPSRLAERAIDQVEKPWPGQKAADALEWMSDHLETLVLLGLIVTVLLALLNMDAY